MYRGPNSNGMGGLSVEPCCDKTLITAGHDPLAFFPGLQGTVVTHVRGDGLELL